MRCVSSQQASDHVDPAALGEGGKGRLYQFLAKSVLPSKLHEGYTASTVARFAGWSSGARRRDERRPEPYFSLRDAFELIAAQSKVAEQLSVRSWWPAGEFKWGRVQSLSFRNSGDVSITTQSWASFPEIGSPGIAPRLFLREDTARVVGLPTAIAPASQVISFLNSAGPPHPHPS